MKGINKLLVRDLKEELKRLQVKFKTSAKKAELIQVFIFHILLYHA